MKNKPRMRHRRRTIIVHQPTPDGPFVVSGVLRQDVAAWRVTMGKMVALMDSGEHVRVSGNRCMPIPAIVLTSSPIPDFPKFPMPPTKNKVRQRDGFTCGYCGGYGDTVDHIHPRSRGGLDKWNNLITACGPCNRAKGSRTLDEIHSAHLRDGSPDMQLLFQPRTPQRYEREQSLVDNFLNQMGSAFSPNLVETEGTTKIIETADVASGFLIAG